MAGLSPHERALNYGLSVTRNSFGVPVTYTRGATTLTISSALQGETLKGAIDVSGTEQIVELQDWLLAVSDLGSLWPPTPGDLITRNIDGTDNTFTVEYRQAGESLWDWSDTGKTQVRLRTRKDGASAFEVSEPTGFDISGNEIRA